MFTLSRTQETAPRNRLSSDKRVAIAEYVLDYVKRNPGKQIPTQVIGKRADTPSYNVSTIIRQLVVMGEIRHLSRYTYELVPKPAPAKPEQLALAPLTPRGMAIEIERMAKDYVWQVENPTLKGFVDWAKTEAR